MRASPMVEQEVIPPDERQLVRDTLAVPFRWVCSLDLTFDKPYPKGWRSGFGRGTGLLIGPRQVLTAAHNIYPDGSTSPASVHAAPARNGRVDPLGRVEAVAYSVPARTFGRHGIDRQNDFGVVTLERDIASQRHRALGDRPLGHWGWGSASLGHGTVVQALGRNFLRGKQVVVCGYPGDRCGTEPLQLPPACEPDWEQPDCPERDHATTQWIHNGTLSWRYDRDPLFLHTADTARGQSGSPVWLKTVKDRRYLVGIHVVPECRSDAEGKRLPFRGNLAVHVDDRVLAMIRSWMG